MAYEFAQSCMLVDIGLTRSECASWVQAIGSIGAIVAGFWVAWYTLRRQERARARHWRDAAVLALTYLNTELHIVWDWSRETEPDDSKEAEEFENHIRDALKYVRSFPMWEVESLIAADMMSLMRLVETSYPGFKNKASRNAVLERLCCSSVTILAGIAPTTTREWIEGRRHAERANPKANTANHAAALP